MVDLTASIPTPRPETSRDGRGGRDAGRGTRAPPRPRAPGPPRGRRCRMPASTARRRTDSRSMPRPSSETEMRTWSRSRRASISDAARRRLAGARGARSGDSMPWSTALRIRCTSGSASRSRIARSSSSSAPRSSTSTVLPSSRARPRAPCAAALHDAQQRRGAQTERAALQIADHALHAVEAGLELRGDRCRSRRPSCAAARR